MTSAPSSPATQRHRRVFAHHRVAAEGLVAAVVVCLCLAAPAHSLNTCEAITRCSECVYDQTQGIMPPPLRCGWCASTQSCKVVNSSVLAYYGVTTGTTTDKDGEEVAAALTPEEMAAYRAAFCPDLRERNVNGVCPDMSCAAAKTTNNIYICRAPPLIALVFSCILFVLSLVVYVWMRTIRQLPWKYEPFLSDLLEGRTHSLEEPLQHVEFETAKEEEVGEAPAPVAAAATVAPTRGGGIVKAKKDRNPPHDTISSYSPLKRRPGSPRKTTRPGSPLSGDTPYPLASHVQPNAPPDSSSDDDETDAASAATTSVASSPSFLDNVSHNVVVAHHPHGPTASMSVSPTAAAVTPVPATTAAATGYCPICKCRQPVCLGPGEVCFWCNVARFTFVPFFVALLGSVFVIVLNFAVSLKPWFSDWYYAEVLLIAYASYGALGMYMVHHHNRVPLFFFESEAERKADQHIWSTTHDRPSLPIFSPAVPGSELNSNNSSGANPRDVSAGHSTRRRWALPTTTAAAEKQKEEDRSPLSPGLRHYHRHSDRQKLRLLNDARRNMARTFYFQLALQLRGRPLLTCFPELKQYETQLEAMQASPATLTMVAPVTAAAAMEGICLNTTPASPHRAPLLTSAATTTAVVATDDAGGLQAVLSTNVPATSPFAVALPPLEYITAAIDPSAATNTTAAVEGGAGVHHDAPAGSPVTVSSPSASSRFDNSATVNDRLPPLTHVAANPPPPPPPTAVAGEGGRAANALAAMNSPLPVLAAPFAQLPAPPVVPAGGPIGSPAAANVPESLARQKRGETVQLLSSDFLSPQYCRALKSTLYRDEYITWCSKPNLRGVLMESEWLLVDLAVGFFFGVWMVMLSWVSDTTYTIVQLSGSSAVAACGFIVMLLFAVLLLIVVRQCGRLYVLTNERLITVYESIITPVTTATDLSTVRFAALYGYRGLWSKHPCLTFSWEVPATERKMPAIKSHKFPGITNLQEFLFFFRLVAPQTPFHLEQISEAAKQDRQEWRLHIFLSIGVFTALPIVTIYPQAMPDVLGVFLYALGLLAVLSTLLRGFRSQQMTYAPLNIAASWAPEGELNELGSVNAGPRPLPLVPSLPPPPLPPQRPSAPTALPPLSAAVAVDTGSAPAPSPQQPSPTTKTSSPTSHQQQPLKKSGVSAPSHSVQVATPTTSPVQRTVGELKRPGPITSPTVTVVAGLPRKAENHVVPVAATENKTASATTVPSLTSNAAQQGTGGSHTLLAALPPKPAKMMLPATTAAAAVAAGVSPAAVAAINAAVAEAAAVPVTAAVREMEASLTGHVGVGMTSGALSTNSSFSNVPPTHAGVSSGSGRCTARNSPSRLRPSNIEATPHSAAVPATGAATAAGTAGRVPVGSEGSQASITACNTPSTTTPSAGLGANLSSTSNPRHVDTPPAGPHHDTHHHGHPSPQPHGGVSRSASEGAMNTQTGGSPATVATGHLSDAQHRNSSSSSNGVAGGPGKNSHSSSLAHVVPASARSMKPDKHTTWGDQVGEAEL
jgi:hypothetical protein